MTNRSEDTPYIRWFETLGSVDVALVGGKNASLGEMIQTLSDRSIRVPQGFATASAAYWEFIEGERPHGFAQVAPRRSRAQREAARSICSLKQR